MVLRGSRDAGGASAPLVLAGDDAAAAGLEGRLVCLHGGFDLVEEWLAHQKTSWSVTYIVAELVRPGRREEP